MKCRTVRKHVLLFISGEINKKNHRRIMNHIESCGECREYYKETQIAIDLLKDDMLQPSSHIRERILDTAKQRCVTQSNNNEGVIHTLLNRFTVQSVLAYSGIAVILLMAAVYISNPGLLHLHNSDEELVWEDNFMQDINEIDRDVDRFGKSDNVLAALSAYDEKSAVFTKKFVSIRKRIVELSISN